MRCREEDAERTSLGEAHERGPGRTGGIHHRPDVVDAGIEAHRTGRRVGETRTPLVEDDDPGKGTELLGELCE